MHDQAQAGWAPGGGPGAHGRDGATPAAAGGLTGEAIAAMTRLYPVPAAVVPALLVTGALLGAAGDALLRAPEGPINLNLSLWVALVGAAALVLHRRAGLPVERERVAWLVVGVVFAAGFAWRDAPELKLLALGSATLAFALAAHRLAAGWVRRAGVLHYAVALAAGALCAWTAAVLAIADAARRLPRAAAGEPSGWRQAAAIARGLAIATPIVAVFVALFMSADAMFEALAASVLRFDVEWVASHLIPFAILSWISTGYLRGLLSGTALPRLPARRDGTGHADVPSARWPALGIGEVATVLTAIDLLFLVFVAVQFRYLFGADTLVQVTPGLTYAEYARRGFFELVAAVALVVPILLAADWLLDRRTRRDNLIFRSLAGVQIGLVLAIAASALLRLRLYYDSYGLTEPRLYAMVLLVWIGAMLAWLAATVLRGRRDRFAFGALASGLVTVALLFVVSPDAVIARANVARAIAANGPARFDVAYARSLSADAVPVLVEGLPALPRDVQCPLAQHLLRRWPPDRERSRRGWNWSAARASGIVRAHESPLRAMAGPDRPCAPVETNSR